MTKESHENNNEDRRQRIGRQRTKKTRKKTNEEKNNKLCEGNKEYKGKEKQRRQ